MRLLPRCLYTHLIVACLGLLPASSVAQSLLSLPGTQEFMADMQAQHDFSADELERWFRAGEYQPRIIELISRPAEGKPWHAYRPIFVNAQRIDGGVKFWREHASALRRAEQQFGVPASIIIAIIGVETRYGGNTGGFRVFDALATLAFDYPKRAAFFRKELENYLVMSRDEAMDPLRLKGSYAGAMGLPQFMPSSYRAYAVDFDEDGRRNLFSDPTDAIGSVANYFVKHGWQPGAPVVIPATVRGHAWEDMLSKDLKPQYTLNELKAAGVTALKPAPGASQAALLEYDAGEEPEYWLGLNNFYVITRYNRSPLYALAVYQLSEAIAAARQRRD